MVTTCGAAWVPTTLDCLAGVTDDDEQLLVDAASRMLFNATARQFTGICTDTVRPPAANVAGGSGLVAGSRLADGSLWLGFDGTSTLPQSTFGPFGSSPVGEIVQSPIMAHSTVHLPGFPIVNVTKVTIDGTDLPAGSWLIVSDRYLVRADGLSWPIWQRLDRPAGDPDTWTIEYTYGVDVPPDGIMAARVLACELAKSPAFTDDKSCRLPKRLQSITREGMTAVILDPFTFLDKGRFGIWEIDAFILSANPNQLTRDAKVLSPDLLAHTPLRIR